MDQFQKFVATCAAMTAPLVAGAQPVALQGGWVADFSPSMMETANRSTTVFQFQGSYKMSQANAADVYFLTSCVGMEAATKMQDGGTDTKGAGRCELKDKDGDMLLAAMETAFDGFKLKIEGGTGKWSGASGRIVSKETFTAETERQLKGFSNASGNLEIKK